MKKFLAVLLSLVLLLTVAACGEDAPAADQNLGTSIQPGGEKPSGNGGAALSQEEIKRNQIIASAGVDAVTYEVLESDGESAYIAANVPNYTELLTEAFKTEDPEKAFAEAISSQAYATVEYKGYAKVQIGNDGKEEILVTEILESFVEKELIKAINAVTEAEEGGSQA